MAMTMDELDRCLMLVNGAYRELVAGPDQMLGARGLGRAHHRCLFAIRRQPGIQVGALARVLDVTPQALHKTLRPLLTAGYVEPRPLPGDARVRAMHLTETGERLEASISNMQRQIFAAVANRIGREELDIWAKAMQTIAREALALRMTQAGA